MDEVIRLLIVDDEALVRSGLRLLLDGTRSIRVVGEARDGREAAEKAAAFRADVVLLDIRMPRADGIEGARLITAAQNPPVVLMLTSFDSEGDVVAAFGAGAKGFLLKSAPPQQLVDAVVTAARGQAALSEKVLGTLVQMAERTVPQGRTESLAQLSERELGIAALVAEGLSNDEIARRIHLAVPTVKTNISRIMEKLKATNRVQIAVAYLTGA